MKIENIKPTISDEAAYAQGFYYILLIQTELDGPFMPISNFYIGDAVVKFATPEDAEAHAPVKRYGTTTFGYRIAKVVVEEVKTVENKEAIDDAKAALELWTKIQAECNRIEASFASQEKVQRKI